LDFFTPIWGFIVTAQFKGFNYHCITSRWQTECRCRIVLCWLHFYCFNALASNFGKGGTIFTRIAMPKKRKDNADSEGLWIAPRYRLKGPTGERAWENRPGGVPSHTRFLELADIALGIKKPHLNKQKAESEAESLLRKMYKFLPPVGSAE
jgi:hypothetical protein